MTITSFSNPDVVYQTTGEHCTCPDHQYRNHTCKHMRLARRIEQGRPTNVTEARAARLARRRYDVIKAAEQVAIEAENRAAYARYSYGYYDF